MEILQKVAVVLAIGFIVMAGMRVAEWVIPKPSTKLLVCVADSSGKVGYCKDFKDFTGK